MTCFEHTCACANANGRTGAEYLQHCPRPKTRKDTGVMRASLEQIPLNGRPQARPTDFSVNLASQSLKRVQIVRGARFASVELFPCCM